MQYIFIFVMLFFVVLFFSEAVVPFFSEASTGTIALIIGGIALFQLVLFIAVNKAYKIVAQANKNNKKKQKDFIKLKAHEYKEGLAKKRTQLITKDDYGDVDDSKWKAEIVKFFNKKIGSIPEELALIDTEEQVISAEEIAKIINDVAIEAQKEHVNLFTYSEEMDGIEYEHFCASLLRDSGWDAVVSQASNDQGADIIAERDGVKVAIQCKKYSSPVGNKAVQEVSAGKLHYGTDHAVVVTNNTFTSSAKQLSNSARVYLLHHNELSNLKELLDSELANA